MRKKPQLTHEEYLSLIFQVFTTRKGKLLLDVLEDQFIYRKSYNEGDDFATTAFRDGQRDIILSIINHIENQEQINKEQ